MAVGLGIGRLLLGTTAALSWPRRGCVSFPIEFSDPGLLVGVELPSRVVVAGDEKPCLSLMKFLAMQYLREVGSCCFILGRKAEGVDAISNTIYAFEDILDNFAEALEGIY